MSETALPRFPKLIDRMIGRLPTLPLDLALRRFVGSLADRHPSLFSRLGDQATKAFLIEPTDLSFGFLLRPDPAMPRLEAVRTGRSGSGTTPASPDRWPRWSAWCTGRWTATRCSSRATS